MMRSIQSVFVAISLSLAADAQSQPVDSLGQRLAACTFCHGEQGRAGHDGYYPRLAGKPADYLYHQLLNFQEGRRQYKPMTVLLQRQTDAYLREMARYFAEQKAPYPAPVTATLSPPQAERARQLVLNGDPARQVPACVACHGIALMGTLPATPGLLGLPRDYLNAQLGAWRNGLRKAQAPDCMGEIARNLAPEDVAALSAWLSSQPVTTLAALPPAPASVPMTCGAAP